MTPTDRLRWYAQGFESSDLQTIVERMLHKEEFPVAPGATAHHHAYTGGLAEHTLEVVEYCNNNIIKLGLDYDIVIGAAIIHDWAKIYDYKLVKDATTGEEVWVNTQYKYSIHHVAGSHAEFYRQAHGVLNITTQQAIEHCILSHHGRKEWGSPVKPQTSEALTLHQADFWSASFGPGKVKSVYVS